MKTIELMVRVNATVPDDVVPANVFIDVGDLRNISLLDGLGAPITDSKVNEYETMEGYEPGESVPYGESLHDLAEEHRLNPNDDGDHFNDQL